MNESAHNSRSVAPLLGLVALLGLMASMALALPPDTRAQKEAERVAKKMEKAAKAVARQTKEETETIRHFQKAAARYDGLHRQETERVRDRGPVTAQALGEAIRSRRLKARPGDIFVPEVQTLLRRLISEQLKGPDAFAARRALDEDNPTKQPEFPQVILRINAAYPEGAARSTIPPSLLLVLPPLPESLHYRFVGRDLILVDDVAQIIVDFLLAATPAGTAS